MKRHFLMEAQHQAFAIEHVDLQEHLGNAMTVFEAGKVIEGGGLGVGKLEAHGPVVVIRAFEEFVQAGDHALAAIVNDQVARNGEQPGIEARLAVKLPAADQYPHPDLLKEVFGQFAAAGQKEQVAQQTMLIADDQFVQQTGFLLLEPGGDGKVFLPDRLVLSYRRTRGKQRLYRCERLHLALLENKPAPKADKEKRFTRDLRLPGRR